MDRLTPTPSITATGSPFAACHYSSAGANFGLGRVPEKPHIHWQTIGRIVAFTLADSLGLNPPALDGGFDDWFGNHASASKWGTVK